MNKRIYIILALVMITISLCGLSWSAPTGRIDLAGQWKFNVDTDNSGVRNGWHASGFNSNDWQLINVPGNWEAQGVTQVNANWKKDLSYSPYSGYAWYRKSVTVPADWIDRKIFLNIGKIDDQDSTYLNGVLIGETTYTGSADVYRSYEVPADVIRPGQPNIISVRVLDIQGEGGIVAGPVTITSGEPDTESSITPPVPPAPNIPSDDSVSVGSDTVIEQGQTVNDAVAVRGNVIVHGRVTGDAVAVLGHVILSDTARIEGDAVAVMGRVTKINGGNVKEHIGGEVVNVMPRSYRGDRVPHGTDPGLIVIAIGAMLLMAGLSAAVVALFPSRTEVMASVIQDRPGLSAIYGIVVILLIIPVAIILTLTCIGIPFIIVEILFVVAAWIIGKAVIDLIVGRRLSTAVKRPIINAPLAAAIGSVILALISFIPILGGLVVFAVYILGLGAVFISGFGANPDWFPHRFGKPASPPVAPSAPDAPEPPVAPEPSVAPEPPETP